VTRSFLEALSERVLVSDGAMGTMLYAKGIFLNRSFDELNLTQPDLVTEVHQTTGGRFIPNFNAAQVVDSPWGMLTFTFTDRDHGVNEPDRAVERAGS
jgi:S-methylmethionine-dependent homocysteine/selenocysteine methylase